MYLIALGDCLDVGGTRLGKGEGEICQISGINFMSDDAMYNLLSYASLQEKQD